MKLVKLSEFKWTDDYSWHRTLTCVNHPTAVYYTKNPFWRHLHIIRFPEDMPPYTECPCPVDDLRVVCEDDGTTAVGKPDYAE